MGILIKGLGGSDLIPEGGEIIYVYRGTMVPITKVFAWEACIQGYRAGECLCVNCKGVLEYRAEECLRIKGYKGTERESICV